MTGSGRSTLAAAFQYAALPLAWYYLVTLALPVANGAVQSSVTFARHALVVLVLPPMLLACACAIHMIVRMVGERVGRRVSRTRPTKR